MPESVPKVLAHELRSNPACKYVEFAHHANELIIINYGKTPIAGHVGVTARRVLDTHRRDSNLMHIVETLQSGGKPIKALEMLRVRFYKKI